MLLFIFAFSFLLYSGAFYYYSTRLYGRETKVLYAIATLFNSIFYIYYIFYVSFVYEYIALSVLFLLYVIEVRLIFKQKIHMVLFRALTMCVHVLAMRMVLIGIFALCYDMPIPELVADQDRRILISTVFFFSALPYVLLVKIIFTKIQFVEVVKNGQHFLFSLYFLLAIFIYDLASLYLLYPATYPEVRIIYLVIKIGVCSLLGFFLCFIFDFIFSVLNMHKAKYTSLSTAIREGQKDIELLSEQASVDAFTTLKVRDVAYTRIEHFLDDNEPFYVAFVDMNGLKLVNDNYGHNEGDWYILQTVEKLKNNFTHETISRLGGDEFLIVGKNPDSESLQKRITVFEKQVASLADDFSKLYETSISYGLVEITNSADYQSVEDIVKLADDRMYAHKTSMRKQRNVIQPS